MRLYILRHGKAEEHRPNRPDADRHLTPEGIEEMRAEAAGMVALQLRFDAIFSSPLARALETAQIVAEAYRLPTDAVRVDARLASGVLRMGSLQALLEGLPHDAHLLIVGHEPDLSGLVGALTGGTVEMKKGGLACVEAARLEPGSGVLRWLLTPTHLLLHAPE